MPYTRTTWVNLQAPDINATNLNNLELGVVAAPYGPDASANFVPVWNGSIWTYSGVKNAHVDAAAAIAYSKLNLATSIVNGDISGSAAIAYAKLNLATSIVNADIASAAAVAVSKLAAGSNGQVLTTTAGVPTWGAAGGITTYRKTTSKAVTNSVADTDLLNGEITVAANAIGASGFLRLTAMGDWVTNTGADTDCVRLKLKLGGTTIIDTGTIGAGVVAASASRFGWKVVAEIHNLGATNSQWSNFLATVASKGNSASLSGGTGFTTGEGSYVALRTTNTQVNIAEGGNSSAVDTTASQALVLSVVNPSATATCETKLFSAIVEII